MRTTPSPPISLGSDDTKQQQQQPQMSIYVPNLPANCTMQQLQVYFSQFAPGGVSIQNLRPTTATKASAFVQFDSAQHLDQVLALYKANSLPSFENAQIRLERCNGNNNTKAKTQYQFPVYIGRVPKSITDEEIFALVPKTAAPRLRRSTPLNGSPAEQDYRFLFIDCKTLESAQLCVSALEQTELCKQHKLRVELAHQSTATGIAEREAVSVFRRSVLFPEVPVGVTKDDLLIVLEVFGRVKRIDFILLSAAVAVDIVPMNLWRVEVDFDTPDCASAARNLLLEDGFTNATAMHTRVVLDNVASQPSLPELLDMFSQIGPVHGAQVIKVPTAAEVEFETESTAREVMKHGPILLRACWIKPELTTLKTKKL